MFRCLARCAKIDGDSQRRSSTPFEVITDARVVTLIEFNASINSYKG